MSTMSMMRSIGMRGNSARGMHVSLFPTSMFVSRTVHVNPPRYTGLFARRASTATTAQSRTNASSSAPALESLTWNKFFAFRRSKKIYERTAAILGSFLGFSFGGYYFFFHLEFDPTVQLFGLPDPTIAYVLGAVSFGIAGTVGGIMFGGTFWRLATKRQTLAQIDAMESTFFKRMAKHRPKAHRNIVNPATGTRNFAPDYYGEHIYSLSDYRQWIRKQRRFSAGIITNA